MRPAEHTATHPSRAVVFLPLAIFVGITTLLGIYLGEAQGRERASVQLKTALTVDQVALRIEQFFATRLAVVEHVAEIWMESGSPTEPAFRDHVDSLSRSISGVVAINWIDDDGIIRWVVPETDNLAAIGRDVSRHPVAGPVLERARADRALRVTPPVTLFQGGTGFAAYAPVVLDGRVAGFVNVAFRVRPTFDDVLGGSVRERFHVEVKDGDRTLYRNHVEGTDHGDAYREARPIRVGDRIWTLSLWPGAAQVYADHSAADETVAGIGILIAAGLSYAAWRIARSRAEIAAAERRYRTVVEDSPVLICRSGPDGVLRFVNQAYARYFGVESERLVGTSFFDLVPPEDHERLRRGVASMSVERPTQRHEHRVLRADGCTAWVEWTNRGYFDRAGRLLELQSFGVDRTDAHEARRSLEASEVRFREIFNAVSDGILVLDTDGVVLDVNRSGCEVFRLDRGSIVGRRLDSLADDDADPGPSLAETVARVVETGAGAALRELDLLRPDGVWRGDVELRRAVLGDATRVLAVVRDVTERSRLEEQLRQSQKMEAMGTLASGIAHDFNNVLTAILGHAEIAREHLDDGSPAARSVEGIASACDQASGVTRSLLAMGRQVRTRRSPLEMTASVRQTLQMIRPLLRDAIAVDTDIPEDDTLWIQGDGAQIQQVVINLTLNARDAIRDGGAIVVRLRGEPPGRNDDGPGAVVLEVSDDGVGMTEDVRRRVLEPFFTTKPRERGTGLGMSVVHGIVLAHDGGLDIRSRPGHGTTVSVRFPACAPARTPAESPVPEAPAAPTVGGRILVVEDNTQVRRLLLEALTAAGFVVDSAADGIDGLAAWSLRVDLMIVDVDLPRMGGREMVRRIRQQDAHVPVILISGNPDVGPHVADGPRVTFLEKPFRLATVIDLVRRTLADSRGPSSGDC